jgi:hypothetical protein
MTRDFALDLLDAGGDALDRLQPIECNLVQLVDGLLAELIDLGAHRSKLLIHIHRDSPLLNRNEDYVQGVLLAAVVLLVVEDALVADVDGGAWVAASMITAETALKTSPSPLIRFSAIPTACSAPSLAAP